MSTTAFGSGRRHQGERGGGSKGHTPIEDKVDGRNGCDDALWVDDEYIVWIGGSGTYGRVRDDTAVVGVVFHGDIKVDADEDATARDGIGECRVVDKELVGEGHGRRWGARWDRMD